MKPPFNSVIIIFIIASCNDRGGSSEFKPFHKLQKQGSNDTIQKWLLPEYDSLKSINGDSLAFEGDIYINDIDTTAQIESKIIDTITRLKEVKERDEYIRKQTNRQRHLQSVIWQKPTSKHPYYWIKVMEDNGTSNYTHFNFYVKLNPFQVLYYDTISDTILDLGTWRKNVSR